VTSVKPGQFVIGSFFASDNTCPYCHHGFQTSCELKTPVGGAQAPRLRVPLADGTLFATRDVPDGDHIPSMLALSDVMGTGWFAADAANVKAGSTVVVVGDGAVGLLGVLSAKQMGAERIIAMSLHEARQRLAREFGATDIVTARGDEGIERIKQLTNGVRADSVLECVGTQESMMQAIKSTRPGGSVGYVGRAARCHARRRRSLFPSRSVARWSGARSAVSTATDRSRLYREDQSRKSVRPRAAARSRAATSARRCSSACTALLSAEVGLIQLPPDRRQGRRRPSAAEAAADPRDCPTGNLHTEVDVPTVSAGAARSPGRLRQAETARRQ
jgi:NADPH:quinone reductase-like Zn-dependent oxidoreductase